MLYKELGLTEEMMETADNILRCAPESARATSLLQRKMKCGFIRANKILDALPEWREARAMTTLPQDADYIGTMQGKPANKKAATRDEAWKIQETYEGQSHCWIQWKGTEVCMDFHCVCGNHSHIDELGVYFIKCQSCGKVFMTNGHIELIEITEEKIKENHITEAEMF